MFATVTPSWLQVPNICTQQLTTKSLLSDFLEMTQLMCQFIPRFGHFLSIPPWHRLHGPVHYDQCTIISKLIERRAHLVFQVLGSLLSKDGFSMQVYLSEEDGIHGEGGHFLHQAICWFELYVWCHLVYFANFATYHIHDHDYARTVFYMDHLFQGL